MNIAVRAAIETAPATGARVVVLAGTGGSFCSGLDLKWAAAEGMDASTVQSRMRSHFHGLIRALRDCPVPTVAVLDGVAAGFGCDLALACDLRLCSDRARFGEIFVKRGLMPDGGGTWALPRLVGLGRALEMCLTGDMVDAAEAKAIGLANRVFPAAQLEAAALDFLRSLAAGPPLVHRAVKAAVYAGWGVHSRRRWRPKCDGQLKLLGSAGLHGRRRGFSRKAPPTVHGRVGCRPPSSVDRLGDASLPLRVPCPLPAPLR